MDHERGCAERQQPPSLPAAPSPHTTPALRWGATCSQGLGGHHRALPGPQISGAVVTPALAPIRPHQPSPLGLSAPRAEDTRACVGFSPEPERLEDWKEQGLLDVTGPQRLGVSLGTVITGQPSRSTPALLKTQKSLTGGPKKSRVVRNLEGNKTPILQAPIRASVVLLVLNTFSIYSPLFEEENIETNKHKKQLHPAPKWASSPRCAAGCQDPGHPLNGFRDRR